MKLLSVLIIVGCTISFGEAQSPDDMINELVSLMQQLETKLPPDAATTIQDLTTLTRDVQAAAHANNLEAAGQIFHVGADLVARFLSQIQDYPQLRPYYIVYLICLKDNQALNAKFDAGKANFGDGVTFLQSILTNLGSALSTSSGPTSTSGPSSYSWSSYGWASSTGGTSSSGEYSSSGGSSPSDCSLNPDDMINELVSLMQQLETKLPPDAATTIQDLTTLTRDEQAAAYANNLEAAGQIFHVGADLVARFLSQIQDYPQLRPYYIVYLICLKDNQALNAKFDAGQANFGDGVTFLQSILTNLGSALSTSSGPTSTSGPSSYSWSSYGWTSSTGGTLSSGGSNPSDCSLNLDDMINELVSLMQQLQTKLPPCAATTIQDLTTLTRDVQAALNANNLEAAGQIFHVGADVVARFLSQIQNYPELQPYYNVYSIGLKDNQLLNAEFDAGKANFGDDVQFLQSILTNLRSVLSTSSGSSPPAGSDRTEMFIWRS